MGPCHNSIAHPQVVDGGTASKIDRSSEYIDIDILFNVP